MAVLRPSINAFSLLESNDPGDTYLGNVGAPDKVDAAVSRPVNINKKQQPQQVSVWKANKVKAEANAAKNKQQKQQPAASKAKSNNSVANAGKNRKPQQSAASKVHPSTAADAGKYKKPQRPAASRTSQAKTVANAATNEQFQQHPPAPVNFTQILFGNAYPSARALIYKNRKQNANVNAKDGGASGASATTEDKKGVHADGAAVKDDGPEPVQEEPPAPVKPVLPPPPPPSLDDSAEFPSLK